MDIAVQPDDLIKLARMEAAHVTPKQMAQAIGVTESRLSQIRSGDEYMAQLAKEENEQFEQMDTMNRGWDGVEEAALAQVVNKLHSPIPDPDYALKAAVVANKATRRGKHQNTAIPNAAAGRTVIIQMNTNFVGKLEDNYSVQKRSIEDLPRHAVNTLSVEGVKKALKPAIETALDVEFSELPLN